MKAIQPLIKSVNFYRSSFPSILSVVMLSSFSFDVMAAEGVQGMAANALGSDFLSSALMLAAFAFIFYFLILRPQSKRAKQHRELVTALQKGDEVITAGGLLGRVSRVADDYLVLTISEGIEVVVQRQYIANSIPKGTIKNI